MTCKPLAFPYRSRGKSWDNQDTFPHRSPNTPSFTISKPYYGNNNFKPPRRLDSSYPRPSKSQKKSNYKKNDNNYSNNSRPQSPIFNIDNNRSRQRFSRNCLRILYKKLHLFTFRPRTNRRYNV